MLRLRGVLALGVLILVLAACGGGEEPPAAIGGAGQACYPNATCDSGLACENGTCVAPTGCEPACGESVCGDDGCGGTCGECAQGAFCNTGQCGVDCLSDLECASAETGVCSEDGLGSRQCEQVAPGCFQLSAPALCPEGQTCDDGACHAKVIADCVVIKPIASRVAQPTVGSVAVAFSVATCEGQPLVGLGPSSFAIFEDGAPVSTTESGADILPREAVTYVTLVLDNSPSVKAAGGLEDAVAAAKDFAAQLMTDDPMGVRVAVAVFSIAFELRQEHTSDLSQVEAAIEGLLTDETGVNTTNLYGALIDAIAHNGAVQEQLFQNMRGGVLTQGQVILFTDGSDQAAVATLEAAQAAAAATTDEVRMVAFGTEVDVDVLESLATAGAYVGANSSELGTLFSTIAQQIQAQREALYVLGYCSPKAAGTHQLTIEVPGKGTSPPVSFSAEGWLDAITTGAPSCKAAQFALACADVECGGLWCGGCVELCTEDLLCGCHDPTFTGAYCDQCANPKFAPPDCASCVNPIFTGEACDVCADTKFTGAACDVCTDPAFTGPACDLPSPCPEAPDGSWCDDGDACTVNDACAAGLCEGTATGLLCDNDNPCTSAACDPTTGACAFTNQAGPCADGNGCTTGDYCQAGACLAGINQCACETDADCAWKEDGDLCNGTLVCDTQNSVPACVIDDATVVKCFEAADSCTSSTCVASTGSCESAAAPDGKACGNGDICDGSELCQGGACGTGIVLECSDGKDWTTDSCDSSLGCKFVPIEGAECDDSDVCTIGDLVGAGLCQGTLMDCDDGNLCNGIEACDPVSGCYTSDAPVCPPDADFCTIELCSLIAQECMSIPKSCGDGDPCTMDSCVDGECSHEEELACAGCGDPGDVEISDGIDNDNDGSTDEDVVALSELADVFNAKCDDGDACTLDNCACNGTLTEYWCDGEWGCVHEPLDCSAPGLGASEEAVASALDGVGAPYEGQAVEILFQEITSCSEADISNSIRSISHYGAPENDLSPRKGLSYLIMGTGDVTTTSHQDQLSDDQGQADSVSADTIHDCVEYTLTMTAPTSVTGFALDYLFLSAEFHEWVGSSFNDKFYIVLNAEVSTGGVDRVINFAPCSDPNSYSDFNSDGSKWCYIGINTYFSEPCPGAATDISGTGHECEAGGSSTGWLTSAAPITPGETFSLTFHIHDSADQSYDSTVLIDNFRWLTGDASFGPATVAESIQGP